MPSSPPSVGGRPPPPGTGWAGASVLQWVHGAQRSGLRLWPSLLWPPLGCSWLWRWPRPGHRHHRVPHSEWLESHRAAEYDPEALVTPRTARTHPALATQQCQLSEPHAPWALTHRTSRPASGRHPSTSGKSCPLPFRHLCPPHPGGGQAPRPPRVSPTQPGVQGGWALRWGTPRDLSKLTPGRQVPTPESRGNTATQPRMLQIDAWDRLWYRTQLCGLIIPKKVLQRTTIYAV